MRTEPSSPQLCYHVYEEPTAGGGYKRLVVSTFYAKKESLSKKLEGAIGNKAGYGTERAAREMETFFRELIDQGRQYVWDRQVYGAPNPPVRLMWLILEPRRYDQDDTGGYGNCEIHLGDQHLMDTIAGTKFVTNLAMRIGKERYKNRNYSNFTSSDLSNRDIGDPADVIETLERSWKAIKVRTIHSHRDFYISEWVNDDRPRPYMLTDTLWRTFEVRR